MHYLVDKCKQSWRSQTKYWIIDKNRGLHVHHFTRAIATCQLWGGVLVSNWKPTISKCLILFLVATQLPHLCRMILNAEAVRIEGWNRKNDHVRITYYAIQVIMLLFLKTTFHVLLLSCVKQLLHNEYLYHRIISQRFFIFLMYAFFKNF